MNRILVLNYEFPPIGGGGSGVSYDISKEYIKLGYQVDVITMSYKGLLDYEQKDGMNIYRVKSLRTKKQVCHPWEQLTYIYSGYKKAKELLKQNQYIICHCHFIIPTGVLAMLLKKKYSLEYIVTAHGSDVIGHNPRFRLLYKILYPQWKKIINNCKYIVSPSIYLGDKITHYYGKSEKLQIIPNGIDTNKFNPMDKENYILLVARLVYGKGIQDFLHSIGGIDLKDWKVKIVGEGPYKEELEKIIVQYNLQDKIEFLGWIDNKSDKMKQLYGKASIFCQPSYFENASIVLLEAMQAGCVVLARNTGGNPETILKEALFDNIEDLGRLIASLISSGEYLSRLQSYNLSQIQNYNRPQLVKQYEELF